MSNKDDEMRYDILNLYAQGVDHYYVSNDLGISFDQWEYYLYKKMSSELRAQIKHARRLNRQYKEEENIRKAARGL